MHPKILTLDKANVENGVLTAAIGVSLQQLLYQRMLAKFLTTFSPDEFLHGLSFIANNPLGSVLKLMDWFECFMSHN